LQWWATLAPMKMLLFFLVVLLLIGGGMKLAGQQIPILDYPLGGPMTQPQIHVIQPDIHVP
jgi:Na+/citrate or Na+/malate symporter